MVYEYQGSVTSEITSVCQLVADLMEQLRKEIAPSQLFDVRLILSELMIKGCEHGNGNDRRKKVSFPGEPDPEKPNPQPGQKDPSREPSKS